MIRKFVFVLCLLWAVFLATVAFGADKPEIFVQIGHSSGITAVEFSPDGKYILTGSEDNSARLWDVATGRLMQTFQDNEDIKFLAFLPGGEQIFSVNEKGNICIWNIRNGDRIREFSLGDVGGMINDPIAYDGVTLRAIVGIKMHLADMGKGAFLKTVVAPHPTAISGYLGFGFGFRNAVTSDGRRMLSSVRENTSESIMASKFKRLMLWDIATGRILETFSGHDDMIDVIALSADDRYGLTGGRDKTVRMWDLKRGKTLAVFRGHQKPIETVAISPDKKYVLSGSRDNTMRLWDVDDEKEVRTFPHDCPVKFVRFSTDGRQIISGDDKGVVRFWDFNTGAELKELKSLAAKNSKMALSSDGRSLLTASDSGHIRFWDTATGKLQKSISAHKDWLSCVMFTSDDRYVLSASYSDNEIKLWETQSGKLYKSFPESQAGKAVVSPDGRYMLSSRWQNSMTYVRLWDIAGGAEVKTFSFPGSVHSIGFSADSRYILIGHDQKKSGHAVVVLAPDGREVRKYADVSFTNYSMDGRYFLAREYKEVSGREAKLFDPETKARKSYLHTANEKVLVDIVTGKVSGRFGQSGAFVSLSMTAADRDLVLTKHRHDPDICLWNVKTGAEIRRFPAVFGLLSSDGKKIVAPAGKTLQVFDTATGRMMKTFAGSAAGDISAMALSSGGGYAVTGDRTGSLQFWDVDRGVLMRSIKAEERDLIVAVAFSADNQYAACATGFGSIKVWSLRDGNKISEIKTDYVLINYDESKEGIYVDYGYGALAFSPDSRWLACGKKIWNAATGRQVIEFQGFNAPGPYLAFSPDGNYLLSNSSIWDVSTGQRAKKMMSLPSSKAFYSPDGRWIYAIDYEGAFYVGNPETGKLVNKYVSFVENGPFQVARDQKTMIAKAWQNSKVSLWNPSTGRKIAGVDLNQEARDMLFDFDKNMLFVDHGASTSRYDFILNRELAQFIGFADGEWIVITPEGYYNASPGGDKYLNVRVNGRVYGIENYREAFYRPDLVKMALSGGSLKDFRKLGDIKQPPAVQITDTPAMVKTDEVTVHLNLTDQGGGIGDIRLYLNGTAVVMDSRSVKITPKDKKALLKEYVLKLTSGRNVIKAVAFNADNSMQSNETVWIVTATYTQSAKLSLSALVIGINDFKNPKLKLQYSAADADLFAATLQNGSAGLFDKVTIKILTKPQETTSEAILREIKSFQSLRPDDLFVFYIASHGTVDEGEYFLITSNVGSLRTEKLRTDAISQHQLKEAIANIPATKKLIIIDTCNAGALGEAIQVAMMTRGMSEDTALKILSRAMGSTILSASTSMQEALEGYQGHGLFTYVLTEGLKGKADKGKTGYVKTTELADYVDNEVPHLAEKVFKRAQYPTISISGQAFPIGKVK